MKTYQITKRYNRQAGGSWIYDKIELIREDGDIILRHTHKIKTHRTLIQTSNEIIYGFTAPHILNSVTNYLLAFPDLYENIKFTSEEINDELL